MSGPGTRTESGLHASISVGELARRVRALLEHEFPLVRVTGELSNVTRAASGHWYFTLKDNDAQVRAAMFKNRAQWLDWTPKAGDAVEVQARVSLYEPRGDFQLIVESMRRGGAGDLYAEFLRLKDKLEREGLFNPERKRELPALPRAVGIVTSREAAALRDVLKILAERAPMIPVIIYPTQVQGDAAPAAIVAAIERANQRDETDVLIVCRGGGSIEDLWAFNDERVVRAVAASRIPTVAGVGHETDVTLTDFAADVRAPTPTAAAALASPDRDALAYEAAQQAEALHRAMHRAMEQCGQQLDLAAAQLVSPAALVLRKRERFAAVQRQLPQAMRTHLQLTRHAWRAASLRLAAQRPSIAAPAARLASLSRTLSFSARNSIERAHHTVAQCSQALVHLNPQHVLERGFSITRASNGSVIRNAAQLAAGDKVALTFATGGADADITRTRK